MLCLIASYYLWPFRLGDLKHLAAPFEFTLASTGEMEVQALFAPQLVVNNRKPG